MGDQLPTGTKTRSDRLLELLEMYLADPTNADVIAELQTMSDLITPEIRAFLTGGMVAG